MSTDEDNVHEDVTLSHIASKMPAPPPRPASISSAHSSRRSSSAASQSRQPKLPSMTDGDTNEAPPTPSLSCLYNAKSTQEQTSNMPALITNTSLSGEVKRALSSSPSAAKSLQSRTPSTSTAPLVPNRRSKTTLKEKLYDADRMHTDQNTNLQSSRRGRHDYLTVERAERLQQGLYASADLTMDLIDASFAVASVSFSPVYNRAVHLLRALQPQRKGASSASIKEKRNVSSVDRSQLSASFAQRFKTVICSSHLLSKSLTVSKYEETAAIDTATKEGRNPVDSPASEVLSKSISLHSQESATNFSAACMLLFDAAIIASIILAPICRDGDAWTRSTVVLVSFVWISFYMTDASQEVDIRFEITHQAIGPFSLLTADLEEQECKGSDYMASSRAIALSETMCEMAQDLVKSCQSFDIECNKSIALIQEVELVSRGYKLSRPFPPISRIEATEAVVSPYHNKAFAAMPPQSAPAVIGAPSRLSRSSSSGGSSISGWKHGGPRPQSILFSNTSTANGRVSPQSTEQETVRLASLRKSVATSLDGAKGALENAIDELRPLVDEKELSLLEEMYDVNNSSQDRSLSPVSEPWTAIPHSALPDRSSSGTPLASRGRMENEVHSSTDDDSAGLPMTPQLDYFPQGNYTNGTYGKPRRRDSSASEAWSATSPSRETPPPIRIGSRLSYISDKTSAMSTTPNQTAASKRLSYIASAAAPAQTRASHMKTHSTSVPFGGQAYRKRMSLINANLNEEDKDIKIVPNQARASHPYLIATLRASFEDIHSLRRRLFCHLLALDITLKRKATITKSTGRTHFPTVSYWSSVERVVKKLTDAMSRMAALNKAMLQAELIDTAPTDGTTRVKSDGKQGAVQSHPVLQERLAGMGQALRSIQVKMKACSEEVQLKVSPTLHGFGEVDSSSAPSSVLLLDDKPERLLETVREDLLTLSAEWESALKILQMQPQEIIQPTGANADVTSSALSGSRLDSPQEADEDAIRQWVPSLSRDAKDTSESEEERLTHAQIENGVLQWSSKGTDTKDEQAADVSEMLVKAASPEHLPPPGLEKVYESMSQVAENKMQKSIMSREERIRMVKEQRAAKETSSAARIEKKDSSAGMIRELQAVMKSRKNKPDDAILNRKQAPISSPMTQSIDQTQYNSKHQYDTIKQSSTGSTAAFAF